MSSRHPTSDSTGQFFAPGQTLPLAITDTGLHAISGQVHWYKSLRYIPGNTDARTTLDLLDISLATPFATYSDLLLANINNTLVYTPSRRRKFHRTFGAPAAYTLAAEETAWMTTLPYLSLGCDPQVADQAASLTAFWVACTQLDDYYDRKRLRGNRRTARSIWGDDAAMQFVAAVQDTELVRRGLTGNDPDFTALWRQQFDRVLRAERHKLALGSDVAHGGYLPTMAEYKRVAVERLSFFTDFYVALAERAGRGDLAASFVTIWPWFAWQSQIRNDLKNHGMTNAGREYDEEGLPVYHGEAGERFSDITDGRITFSTVTFFEQADRDDIAWVLGHVWNKGRGLERREYRYLMDMFAATGTLEAIIHRSSHVDALVENMLLQAAIPEPVRDLWYGHYHRMLKTFISANYKDPNPYRLQRFRRAVQTLAGPALEALPPLKLAAV